LSPAGFVGRKSVHSVACSNLSGNAATELVTEVFRKSYDYQKICRWGSWRYNWDCDQVYLSNGIGHRQLDTNTTNEILFCFNRLCLQQHQLFSNILVFEIHFRMFFSPPRKTSPQWSSTGVRWGGFSQRGLGSKTGKYYELRHVTTHIRFADDVSMSDVNFAESNYLLISTRS